MNTQKTTTEQQVTSAVLDVKEITVDQLRAMNREYNAAVWDQRVNRLLSYADVKVYHAAPQRGYGYDRFYAAYTIAEGIRFFQEVSYGSSLTNAGFCRIQITDGVVYRILLQDTTGKFGRCENNMTNRKIMAINSNLLGHIFSNQF